MNSNRQHLVLSESSDSSVSPTTIEDSKPQARSFVRRSLSLSDISQHIQEEKHHSASSFRGDNSPASTNELGSPVLVNTTTQKISRMLATSLPTEALGDLAKPSRKESLDSDVLITEAKQKIIDKLYKKFHASVTSDRINLRDILISFMDHIVDESQEVLSWTPEVKAEEETNDYVGIHYRHDLFASMIRVAIESANYGYAPGKVAHLRDNTISFLNGIDGDFSKKNATIYIPICYTSEKHLTGKALKKVIQSYLDKQHAAKVVIYLGRTEEINEASKEESKAQLDIWLLANKDLMNPEDSRIQVVQRAEWIASAAYENAKKLFASELINKPLVISAIEQDILSRLVQKKILQKSSKANNQPQQQITSAREDDSKSNALPLSLSQIMDVIKAPGVTEEHAHKLGAFFRGNGVKFVPSSRSLAKAADSSESERVYRKA